jgi:LmbE family N-acetylglucosaminyl deacetylase
VPVLVFVAAHPDDDTFGVGRSVALHAADADLRLVLVHATDGEAGEVAPDVVIGPDGLGAQRRIEAAESWRAIGRSPDRHEWFGLPDGGLETEDFPALVDRLWEVLADERPDVVATFGPDGITGHPDHVVISRATTDAFMRGVAGGGSGFRRLLHGCIPRSQIERWNRNLSAAGLTEWDPAVPFHLRGVPDAAVGISVDTRSVARTAVAAIRAHRSQWSAAMMPISDEDLARSLRTEDWVIAWPPEASSGAPLTDVFEGL